MANVELRVMGQTPVPMGKLKLDDGKGYTEWTFIPMAAGGNVHSGKVTIEGRNSKLINGAGRHAGKLFGTLINFNLLHYNKNIAYTLKSGNHNYRCKSEDSDMDF